MWCARSVTDARPLSSADGRYAGIAGARWRHGDSMKRGLLKLQRMSEIDADYIAGARKRLADHQAQPRLFAPEREQFIQGSLMDSES